MIARIKLEDVIGLLENPKWVQTRDDGRAISSPRRPALELRTYLGRLDTFRFVPLFYVSVWYFPSIL